MQFFSIATILAASMLSSAVALAASDSPLTINRMEAVDRERSNDLGPSGVTGGVGVTDRGDIMDTTGTGRLGGAAQAPRPGVPDSPEGLQRGLGTTPPARALDGNAASGSTTGPAAGAPGNSGSSGAIGSGTRLDGSSGSGLGTPATGGTGLGSSGTGNSSGTGGSGGSSSSSSGGGGGGGGG